MLNEGNDRFSEKSKDDQRPGYREQQRPTVGGKFSFGFWKRSAHGAGTATSAAVAQVTLKLEATAGTDGHLIYLGSGRPNT